MKEDSPITIKQAKLILPGSTLRHKSTGILVTVAGNDKNVKVKELQVPNNLITHEELAEEYIGVYLALDD